VTWEPLSISLAVAGMAVWCAAMLLAVTDWSRSSSRWPWGLWAVLCAMHAAFWFLMYLGALYED
jgi:hypothetical protein